MIESGKGTPSGVFSGEIEAAEGEHTLTFWYFKENDSHFSVKADENGTRVVVDVTKQSFFSLEDLSVMDLMSSKPADESDEVPVLVKDGKATVMKDVTMESRLAMARFSLSGLPSEAEGTLQIYDADKNLYFQDGFGVSSTYSEGKLANEDASIEVSGVTDKTTDVYVALIPNRYNADKYRLGFKFTNKDNTVYTYEFTKPTEIKAGLYYTTFDKEEGASTGTFSGIPVVLQPETTTEPETPVTPVVDEDLVGKMFEVNGKKFRFTRANLKYTVETGVWSLMDRQYSFICKGGWTLSNGTWCTTGTYQQKEAEIDMFGFGTTGLYDIESGETAQAPTFWRQTANQSYSLAAYYYPTNNTTTNMGSGFIGSNLEHGTQFTNFDWGKVYQLNKNGEAYPSAEAPYTSYDKDKHPDVLRYFTLSSDDWSQLQSKYFMCGATITGIANTVNTAAKNNIYGCLIFPIKGDGANSAEINNDKLAKVKDLLEGKVTYISSKLTTNLSFTGTNYTNFDYSYVKMTSAQFDELEKLGVVFLPEAGHRATDSYTKTDGYYWTSTAGQQYASTFFRFDGDSSPRVFKLEGLNRSLGGSVRLVKEVPEDYEDPEVVD